MMSFQGRTNKTPEQWSPSCSTVILPRACCPLSLHVCLGSFLHTGCWESCWHPEAAAASLSHMFSKGQDTGHASAQFGEFILSLNPNQQLFFPITFSLTQHANDKIQRHCKQKWPSRPISSVSPCRAKWSSQGPETVWQFTAHMRWIDSTQLQGTLKTPDKYTQCPSVWPLNPLKVIKVLAHQRDSPFTGIHATPQPGLGTKTHPDQCCVSHCPPCHRFTKPVHEGHGSLPHIYAIWIIRWVIVGVTLPLSWYKNSLWWLSA